MLINCNDIVAAMNIYQKFAALSLYTWI